MQIGLIIYGALRAVSGGYLYDRKLVEYLQSQGDQVEVISLPARNYTRCLQDNLSNNFYRRLVDFRGDLLLQDELNHPSLFWLNGRLRAKINYPVVSIVHHLRSSEHRPAWQNRFYRQVERRYLRSVDGFIYNSHTTRQAVKRAWVDRRHPTGGFDLPYVIAYPAGDRLRPDISEPEILQRAYAAGPIRLVFLGNLIPRKGLHTLLESLTRLPRQAWELTVIGNQAVDRGYTRTIYRLVKKNGLNGNVRLTGLLDDAALANELRTSQVLVVPSTYEGFGIVYLEGMGFGLPSIASSAGATGEIITDGQDGFLVPPGDTVALASRLGELAADRPLLTELSLAAFRRYQAHPTWTQSAARIREFLHGLV